MSVTLDAEFRARESGGASNGSAIYEAVKRLISRNYSKGGIIVDVGCGKGILHGHIGDDFDRYIGVDIICYDGYPTCPEVEFQKVNLETGRTNLSDNLADVICCVETIEHVENPRALMRELVRLAKPGGRIIVTTPNQLSLVSKLCLLVKNEFVSFQEQPGLYPAHISALLEIDLIRLARENALINIEIAYTGEGRMPLTAKHWPRWLSAYKGCVGRAFSDNILLMGCKP
jgi:2-polyprenyl-3-methyl-5-hydroxy-6-metoxy-1,4-benzoquinol methylase